MCWLKRRKKDAKINDQGCLLKNLHMIGWSLIYRENTYCWLTMKGSQITSEMILLRITLTVGPMAGERTPEQGNGDSTPVYGSFEEESIELEGEEEPWEQQQEYENPTNEEEGLMKVEAEMKSSTCPQESDSRSHGPGVCSPENKQTTMHNQTTMHSVAVGEEEQAESLQLTHDTVLAVALDQEEGSDLETEDADQQPSVRKGFDEEELLGQNLSVESDSGPSSPEPLALVEDLQEEEELDWDERDTEEAVLHCKKIRKLLSTCSGTEGENDLPVKDAIKLESNNVKKFMVVDSCIFLSRLPLVKELLQEGHCTLYVCYQVVYNPSMLGCNKKQLFSLSGVERVKIQGRRGFLSEDKGSLEMD